MTDPFLRRVYGFLERDVPRWVGAALDVADAAELGELMQGAVADEYGQAFTLTDGRGRWPSMAHDFANWYNVPVHIRDHAERLRRYRVNLESERASVLMNKEIRAFKATTELAGDELERAVDAIIRKHSNAAATDAADESGKQLSGG